MPRLPSSADVPTVRIASDPGLRVPAAAFESPLGVAAEELAPAVEKFAEAGRLREEKIEKARIKQNNRNDTVGRAGDINQYTEDADNEKRRLNTESDFSKQNVLEEFGSFLTQKKQDLINQHRASGASEDSIAKLTIRLGDIQASFTGEVAGISTQIGNDKLDKLFDTRLISLGESAAQDPSLANLDKLLSIDTQSAVDDIADADDPIKEQERLDTAREHIVLSAIDRLIKQGRVEQAESLLIDGRMNRFLSIEKQREVRNTIETVRIRRDETLNKLTEREKRRNRLEARGFSSSLADDIASGAVKVFGPDEFGKFIRINQTTGEELEVDEKDSAVINNAIGEVEPEEVPEQGQDQPGRTIEEAVQVGTGPFAKIQAGISNVFGPFMEGALFEETTSSRQQLNVFSQVAKTALVNNPKFPVAEQEIVANLLPDTDKFFQDPDRARSDLKELKKSLISFKSAKQKELSKKISSKRKAGLADQISRIDEIISLMGDEGTSTPAINTQEEFDKLKKGDRFIWGPTGEEGEKE